MPSGFDPWIGPILGPADVGALVAVNTTTAVVEVGFTVVLIDA